MLVNCIAYQDGKKIADLAVDDINAYVNRPDCFISVALMDATHEELEKMVRHSNLHELAVEDALKGNQWPKVEEYGEIVLTVMHLIEAEGSELHVGEIAVFAG